MRCGIKGMKMMRWVGLALLLTGSAWLHPVHVSVTNLDLDPVEGAIIILVPLVGLVMLPTLVLLLPWVLVRLKPLHRFKPFETYALWATLYFLCINTILWVIFPEHILYILLYYAPVWVMFLLLAPVVYFKARNASDDSEIQANGQ